MQETIKAKLRNDSPMFMHNGRLADPLNKWSRELKALTGKPKKTEEDLQEISRVEWYGGLYTDGNGRIAFPADVIMALVIAGAKKSKYGKLAQAGIIETQPFYPLDYDGPRNIDVLWSAGKHSDRRIAIVDRKKVPRTRPIFHKWSLDVSVTVDAEIVDPRLVMGFFEAAGRYCGIGDHRPRYGRFHVETS